MSPLERDMAELAMASFFERELNMTTDPRPLTAEEMDELRAFLDERLRLAPVYAMIGGGQDFGMMRRLLATLDAERAHYAALVAAAQEVVGAWVAQDIIVADADAAWYANGSLLALRAALDEEPR
jgi:hypothetical protein